MVRFMVVTIKGSIDTEDILYGKMFLKTRCKKAGI
jgi:hypothetical protein